jgi:D-alanyl-D-alanine carboxypeptidase
MDTGEVVFRKLADQPRPVASLTKLMTALVVLDSGVDLSSEATISGAAASQIGTELQLATGERITVSDLLYGLMLASGNDAAVALAEHVAGTEAAFVDMMNARALALGLRHTRFESPTGLDDAGYSTARDIAGLFREAAERPEFARIIGTTTHTIVSDGGGRVRRLQNRNALQWAYPGSIGGKTGFTTPAGHCLVAAARRGDRRMVSVVLGDVGPAFNVGAALLNYGFGAFNRITVVPEGTGVGTVAAAGHEVRAVAAQELVRLVRIDRLGEIERRFEPLARLAWPVADGQHVGTVRGLVDGAEVGVVPAVARLPEPNESRSEPGAGRPLAEVAGQVEELARALADAFL